MKFSCEKSALQKEISFAQEIISSKSSLSIMSNVYLEANDGTLLIRATDVKTGFETRMPVEVKEPGIMTVFCDKLSTILASIPEGSIDVEQKDSRVIIRPSFKKAQFSLKTIASEQLPQLPDIAPERFFSFSAADLLYMTGQTVFAVSDDETRYFMNGVFMERMKDGMAMVATDGRRLAYIKRGQVEGVPEFKGVIIPPKILSILLRRAPSEGQVEIAVNEKNIFINFGNYRLSSVLIEGQFPNYQKVIPETLQYKATFQRQDILDALRRVSIFVEQKSRRTFFSLSTDKIVVSSEETDVGIAREEIPCAYEGPEAVIAMNYKYIEDPLKSIDADSVTLSFTETGKAVIVAPEPEANYFHVLMPMQVD